MYTRGNKIKHIGQCDKHTKQSDSKYTQGSQTVNTHSSKSEINLKTYIKTVQKDSKQTG